MELSNPAADLLGSARASRADSGASPESNSGPVYSKRRLPHFERPWAKYAVAFSTYKRRHLSPQQRDLVLASVLCGRDRGQYELYTACVMPDHVHLLFEPQVKTETHEGKTVFWSLSEILQAIKSSTAHRINRIAETHGPVWERESFDRLIRSESDLQEKFLYICRNPWDAGVAAHNQNYPWLWTLESCSAGAPNNAREGACAPQHGPLNVQRERVNP